MNQTLRRIEEKPEDYKICAACNRLTWYEDTVCRDCGGKEFNNDLKMIKHWIYAAYHFFNYQKNMDSKIISEIELNI